MVAGIELVTDSIAASSAQTQTTPGAICAQRLRLGADAERKQADRDDEEGDRQQRLDAPARRQAQVAIDDRGEHAAHWTLRATRSGMSAWERPGALMRHERVERDRSPGAARRS